MSICKREPHPDTVMGVMRLDLLPHTCLHYMAIDNTELENEVVT